ncbi:MAG: hypothetical protein GTN36_04275 [Candidatus Aenigmarchaeota archaeon]|nr:hypothetical protein [Candidatus Aenigmarchaeota archaeon]
MKKKYYWIIGIVIIVLILFFYPKNCGNWGTAIDPNLTYKECTCFGIKYSEPLLGGGYIDCFGIPISYSCYKQFPSETGLQRIDIPCD